MKKMKSLCLIGSIQSLLLIGFASCAQGFDSNEVFTSKVTDSQLESPAQGDFAFSSKVNADGSESVMVEWPVIKGAGGFQCQVSIVDDPNNPVEIYNDVVDGNSFLFDKQEDTKYEVSVQTLGNEALNNTGATSPTVVSYSTLVPAQIIPAGTEISAFVKANLLDQDEEQAFELVGGETYELNGEVDFGTKLVTFRGDKVNRPIVKMGYDGVIRTSAGLKIKFINFDCTEMNWDKAGAVGLVEGSKNPDPSVEGPKNNAYYLKDPIVFQECWIKNLGLGLFSVGACSWGVEDVRVNDCIIQLSNDGKAWSDAAVFCGYSYGFLYQGVMQAWYGGIKNLSVRNSTLYNIKENSSNNRMVRFNNRDLGRVFTTANGTATFENNTIIRIYPKKEFGNNTPNGSNYTITFNNNICYDVFRLQKFIQGGNTKNIDMTTNTIWGVANSVDNTDKTNYATEEDPLFEGDILKELDFTQPNGGINFKAHGAISSKIGDPRWLE